MNLAAVVFVIALSVQAQRYYAPPYLYHWIMGHVWEAALIACDLPHVLHGYELSPYQVAGAATCAGASLWHYLQLGCVLRGHPLPSWVAGATIGFSWVSVGLLRWTGHASYDALAPVLLALLLVVAWIGGLFIFSKMLTSSVGRLWLGLPFLVRAGFAPLITVVGETEWAWTNYAVGTVLHLLTGAGMVMFLMREGLEALRVQGEGLRESLRLKREFLHTMSHELRTPIAVVAQASAAMVRLDDRAAREEIDAMVQDRTGAMARMVASILDYAKLESGTFEADLVREDLGFRLPDWVEAWRLVAPAGVTLTLELADDELTVDHDPDMLRQAVENLIANAYRVAPPGSTVLLRVWREGREARLSVTDAGPGLAPELHRVVFDRFRQGDGSASRRHGGLGLGLAICREVVEQYHHGRVWVESTPGEGATFHVALSLA